jgi:hypothetical protein
MLSSRAMAARGHPLYGGFRTDEDLVDRGLSGFQSGDFLPLDVSLAFALRMCTERDEVDGAESHTIL